MTKDLQEVTDASALASFETPHTQKEVVPVQWSVEKYKVAQLIALEGKTKTAISRELGIPLAAINTWLKHPEYQAYINQTVMDAATTMKAAKLKNLMKTLNAREAEAEENGWSGYSNKDSLDIHVEIRKECGEDKTVDSSYTGLLEKLVMNSMKHQPKTIDVEAV